jgi:hypothetical protein
MHIVTIFNIPTNCTCMFCVFACSVLRPTAHLVSPCNQVVLANGELLAVLKAGVPPPVDHTQLKRLVPEAEQQTACRAENDELLPNKPVCRRRWITRSSNVSYLRQSSKRHAEQEMMSSCPTSRCAAAGGSHAAQTSLPEAKQQNGYVVLWRKCFAQVHPITECNRHDFRHNRRLACITTASTAQRHNTTTGGQQVYKQPRHNLYSR